MNHKGIIALVHQPRKPGATDDDAVAAANRFRKQMKETGFSDIRIEKENNETSFNNLCIRHKCIIEGLSDISKLAITEQICYAAP